MNDDILAAVAVEIGKSGIPTTVGGYVDDGYLDRWRRERVRTGGGQEHGQFIPAIALKVLTSLSRRSRIHPTASSNSRESFPPAGKKSYAGTRCEGDHHD